MLDNPVPNSCARVWDRVVQHYLFRIRQSNPNTVAILHLYFAFRNSNLDLGSRVTVTVKTRTWVRVICRFVFYAILHNF